MFNDLYNSIFFNQSCLKEVFLRYMRTRIKGMIFSTFNDVSRRNTDKINLWQIFSQKMKIRNKNISEDSNIFIVYYATE